MWLCVSKGVERALAFLLQSRDQMAIILNLVQMLGKVYHVLIDVIQFDTTIHPDECFWPAWGPRTFHYSCQTIKMQCFKPHCPARCPVNKLVKET